MKFVGLPALGILGGVTFGFCGLLSILGYQPSFVSFGHPVAAHKPVLPEIPFTDDAPPDNPSTGDAVVEQEGRSDSPPKPDPHSMLRDKVERLNRGKSKLQGISDYTGKFQKQEVVNGVLLDEQTIAIKCRHHPFSVYLLWLTGDVGREVIYVEGKNNGNLIAHDGGWKSRIPALTLPTDCALVMRDARYPVTTAGLKGLIEIMRTVHDEDLIRSNVATCEIDEHRQFDNRPCAMFTVTYKSPSESSVYRKSVTLIDHEWLVPLHTRHFEWPGAGTAAEETQVDEATLIECYSFTELKMNCGLTDLDFDRTNPEYNFR